MKKSIILILLVLISMNSYSKGDPAYEDNKEQKAISKEITITGKVRQLDLKSWEFEPTKSSKKEISSLVRGPFSIGLFPDDFELNRYWVDMTITAKGELWFIGKKGKTNLLCFNIDEIKNVECVPDRIFKLKYYLTDKKVQLIGEAIVIKERTPFAGDIEYDDYYIKLSEPINIDKYSANFTHKLYGVELMQLDSDIDKKIKGKKIIVTGYLRLKEIPRHMTKIIFETSKEDIKIIEK